MDQVVLERHLRKTTITSNVISIVVGVLVALGVGYGFYYNTTSTLENYGEDLKELQENQNTLQNDVNEIKVYKGVSREEIDGLDEKVDVLYKKVDKMDDKLDRILLQTRE